MNITAVLFDLDDTLYQRTRAIYTWAQAFVSIEMSWLSPAAMRQAIQLLLTTDAGGYCSRSELFTQLKQMYPEISSSVDDLVQCFYHSFAEYIQPMSDMQRLITYLLDQDLPFGIVTNGSAHQLPKIKALGLDTLTSCIVISEVFGKKKPDAEIFLAAATLLVKSPNEIVFIGDHPANDIMGAFRVGMHTAWLRNNQSWPDSLSNTCCEFSIDSLTEMIAILDTSPHRP